MCAYARFVKSQAKTTVTAADGPSLVHVPPADSCTRDDAGFRARPPLLARWSGVLDLDGRADPATFRPQLLSVAEIEPDRPASQNPSIDMGAYAPKIAC